MKHAIVFVLLAGCAVDAGTPCLLAADELCDEPQAAAPEAQRPAELVAAAELELQRVSSERCSSEAPWLGWWLMSTPEALQLLCAEAGKDSADGCFYYVVPAAPRPRVPRIALLAPVNAAQLERRLAEWLGRCAS